MGVEDSCEVVSDTGVATSYDVDLKILSSFLEVVLDSGNDNEIIPCQTDQGDSCP